MSERPLWADQRRDVLISRGLTEATWWEEWRRLWHGHAFDLDDHDQAVQAFKPRLAASEAAAVEEAEELMRKHAGVVVWRRDNDPVVGEEGEPEVVFTVGRVGDFD